MATTTQSRGLGKGISALFSENYVKPTNSPNVIQPSAKTNETRYMLLESLIPGQYQPRREFKEESLQELAESIKHNGIVQPIIVRAAKSEKSKFEIIAGERRWRAAKLAELNQVPVLVREISDKQALEFAIVENIQRQDLSPLEEAEGYQRLIAEFDYTQDALSKIVGKSRSHIANSMRVLTLPKEVKSMIGDGKLSMGHARTLLNQEKPVELAKEIVEQNMSVRQAEQWGKALETKPQKESKPSTVTRLPTTNKPKDADILALEETLSANLGLGVSINDRGQSGEIIISYDSLSELDEILRRLGEGY